MDGVVVDAHAHLGPYSRFFIPGPDAAAMVAVMDRAGVRLAVLSSHRAIQHDARAGNVETLRAVQRFPDRLAGYAVVNPWQCPEEAVARLADEPGFVGVKVHPDLHHYPLTGPAYEPLWDYAARTGLPVLTHTWLPSAYNTPAQADELLTLWPRLRLVLGHAGGTVPGMAAAIEVVQRHPTAFLELCGSSMTGALIGWLVRGVGHRQVLFGSDFPFIEQRMSLGRAVNAGLPPEALAAVLGGNAMALFGLGC
ncbi:amidohydrolase family protein [Fodinicola acaciae]|uniref:amidohydrolase family protein n=1 Tax=Fodinicola acaciae TaxID=2681555 RepID=UPI0013D0306A|nr:amidohydrolase family protein [Fodinicola acaciae]